jgi:serine/threonine protein kinase
MMADPHSRVHEIVSAARKFDSSDARQVYLDDACTGSAELRQQVEALLQAQDQPSTLPDRPTDPERTDAYTPHPGARAVPDAASEQPGLVIGPYTLVQKLGEGGMGAVWAAQQSQPVKRSVALKLIKAGMDSTHVLRRFEAERQALALMDHPNIAKVFDAGITPLGRPYFAMELIQGIPITRYCDQERLSVRQRLELFIPVCQAVQHAHQKGIIHRDLKPSNVLTTVYDGKPVPKIIDFGLAKATRQALTEQTLHTEVGQILGTLEYMAPEQADWNNLDIDTRADIYSLGVILYELLAGSPPFTSRQLRGVEFSEMLRLVREVEPPRPSTRLCSSDQLSAIAANRQMEPRRLVRLVHGDLDWITIKALEKDRARRYETANGLAMDLERYLAAEPVLAHPPSSGYRLKKFLRKHRGAVSALSLVLLALVLGLAGAAYGLRQEAAARRNVQAALVNETRAHKHARQALDDMTSEVVKNLMSKQGLKLEPAQVQFLNKALQSYMEFAAESGSAEEDRAGVAAAYHRIATIRGKLGQPAAAIDDQRAALERFEALAKEFPERPLYREEVASSHHLLAVFLRQAGRLKDAETQERLALAALEENQARSSSDEAFERLSQSLSYLALILNGQGRLPEAADAARQAVSAARQAVASSPENRPWRTNLALLLDNQAGTLAKLGQSDAAIAAQEDAIGVLRALIAEKPDDEPSRINLGNSLAGLAENFSNSGKTQAALDLWAEGITILRAVVDEYPTVPSYRDDLDAALTNRAIAHATRGQLKEAEADFRESLAITRRLTADFPTVVKYREGLISSMQNLGGLLQTTGRLKESVAIQREAIALNRRLIHDSPDDPDFLLELASKLLNLGMATEELGQKTEALACYREAVSLLRPLVAKSPKKIRQRVALARVLGAAAGIFMSADRLDEAQAALVEADQLRAELLADDKHVVERIEDLALGKEGLAQVREARGQTRQAEANLRDALSLFEKLMTAEPKNVHYGIERANSETLLANLLQKRDAFQEARALLDQARPRIDAAVAANPNSDQYHRTLRQHFLATVRSQVRQGDLAAALATVDQIGRLKFDAARDAYCQARALALCIVPMRDDPKRPTEARQAESQVLADRAMACLGRAVAGGKIDPADLAKASDLDSLRSREDFKKLLNTSRQMRK